MNKYIDPLMIISIVSNYFHVPFGDVISPVRKREFIKAKHIAMYFCDIFTHLSYASIGELFSDKDHSTISHAIKSVKGQASIYRIYRDQLHELHEKIEKKMDFEFEKYMHYETEKV